MNLLLDTHTFVWWRDNPKKLSSNTIAAISSMENAVFLSVVIAWELQIKIALNKILLKESLQSSFESEQKINGFRILPVTLPHTMYLSNLPLHHKDPFDRLLIAQAITENMTVLTSDRKFSAYEVSVLV